MEGYPGIEFVSGAITAGFLIIALLFLRFWHRTHDPLFAAFAAAFCLLAINQAIVALGDIALEEQSWVYLLRLAAFVLIIVAIVYKNLERPPRR